MAVEHIGGIATGIIAGGSYLALGFAENIGFEPLTVIEKLGIAGATTVISYFIIRYLLKDKAKLEAKIQQLEDKISSNNEERIKAYKEEFAEIKTLILGQKK